MNLSIAWRFENSEEGGVVRHSMCSLQWATTCAVMWTLQCRHRWRMEAAVREGRWPPDVSSMGTRASSDGTPSMNSNWSLKKWIIIIVQRLQFSGNVIKHQGTSKLGHSGQRHLYILYILRLWSNKNVSYSFIEQNVFRNNRNILLKVIGYSKYIYLNTRLKMNTQRQLLHFALLTTFIILLHKLLRGTHFLLQWNYRMSSPSVTLFICSL